MVEAASLVPPALHFALVFVLRIIEMKHLNCAYRGMDLYRGGTREGVGNFTGCDLLASTGSKSDCLE